MLVCLTGTVCPPKGIKNLKMLDSNKRLREYVDNIIFLIKSSSVDKIVLCENSGYTSYIFDFLKELASLYNKQFEYLSFLGNTELIIKNGRGYGEQEILEYFLKNSCLLQGEETFFKLTGRYIVKNIDTVVYKERHQDNCFVKISPFDTRCNTAFFKVSVNFFNHVFVGCGSEINDDLGKDCHIEGIYKKRLNHSGLLYNNLKILPIFEAFTGSGYVLKKNFIRDTIKQSLNVLGFYSL